VWYSSFRPAWAEGGLDLLVDASFRKECKEWIDPCRLLEAGAPRSYAEYRSGRIYKVPFSKHSAGNGLATSWRWVLITRPLHAEEILARPGDSL